jgi:hypothetical protein
MGIDNQRHLGSTSDPTPIRTKVDVGDTTPRVTPEGRSLSTKELYASGRKDMAATFVPSTHLTPKRRG